MRYLLSEIAAICGGELRGEDHVVERVIVDSRTFPVDSNTLFVAIRTSNRDGAAFVGDLLKRGVRGFLVNRDFADFASVCAQNGGNATLGPKTGDPSLRFGMTVGAPTRFSSKGPATPTVCGQSGGYVLVEDTVTALQALAAHWRSGFTGKVVAITGSTGKTTVKEWIAQLAPAGTTVFRSPKSWNSQIGVPLSILMATGSEDYIIIEAGISKPGEMTVLQHIIRPDVAILTNVGGAHEENFESREQLRAEKMEMLRGCGEVLTGEELTGEFPTRMAALAAEFWRREGHEISADSIAALEPVAMRLEVKEGIHNSVIVNDTYHSDIASLAIALDHLARVAGPRPRIVIMPRSGNAAADLVRASGVEQLIEIGPGDTSVGSSTAGNNANPSDTLTIDEALRSLTSDTIQGRAILIKGGSRLGFDRISRALERRSHTTVMEIDLDAIIHNLQLCRSRLAPGVGIVGMIKAAAYGHGSFEIARTLEQQGVDYLAVAFADEGVALRESGITAPIVVLNADAGSFETMIRHRLEPEIYNLVSLSEFTALLKRHGEQHYPIHIKLDTGMHRLGFRGGDVEKLIETLKTVDRYARVATIFSHLAAADDPAQDDFTRRQIADFDAISSTIAATLPYPVRRHIAATKGAERFPEAAFDMVRLGIGLYGIGMTGAIPAASLHTRIVHIAHLPAGETVGYNRRGVLNIDSTIATIPIGYADGLNRRLSNGAWSVLVAAPSAPGSPGAPGTPAGWQPAPIVGNVCMDSCMIDISAIDNVSVGDEAVIFSSTPGNTVVDMADTLDTIPYEVLTSVSARVKRIYTKE
jgi:alanine racemase